MKCVLNKYQVIFQEHIPISHQDHFTKMEQQPQPQLHRPADQSEDDSEAEAVELVLFHVNECYVYLIPPRMTAASYRADEWNVNKWAWEGVLKVVSKGEDCIIRLEDKTTGELYARAFLREGEQHPVEPVIDSSRYFVLRVEEDIGGRRRHAFIGIGFRERTEAYDFQAALYDHTKYLNKKKVAEEMEQQYQSSSSVDYSLKEGETLVLQIKNKGGQKEGPVSPKFFEQGMNTSNAKEGSVSPKPLLPPPPAPSSTISPVQRSPNNSPRAPSKDATFEAKFDQPSGEQLSTADKDAPVADDDFGDFQAAT